MASFFDGVDAQTAIARLGNVAASAFNGPSDIPNTATRTNHGFSLRTSRGRIVGAVVKVGEQQSRQVDYEYENDRNNHGAPADIIPQHQTLMSLDIVRIDLFRQILEAVFGDSEITLLSDQSRGYRLRTHYVSPSSLLTSGTRIYEFSPCWFTDMRRENAADSDRVIRCTAQLHFLRKERLV